MLTANKNEISDNQFEIRAGNLAVRIARSQAEIAAAQKLRFQVFYTEMGGIPSPEVSASQSDFDNFDNYCDHLLVLDYDLPVESGQVVGTYRLLRRSQKLDLPKFYSEAEFDISAIKNEPGEILELGRSCVNIEYRNRSVMQLLWRGIAEYVNLYGIKLMFGCASLFGTDVAEHKLSLSYLYHYHLAPSEMRAVALQDLYVDMNIIPKEEIDVKEAFSGLPALIKGYLRLGGYVGDGAVIDNICKTVDVAILVRTDLIKEKYVNRYSVS
ncbi:MAG: GNAT family N-acyltransferase [Pseudomonadota bacterium]